MTSPKATKKDTKPTKKKEEKKIPRQLKGTIVSDKMDKTVVVEVVTIKAHPLYKKRYRVTKKYHAHNEKNEFKKGEKVLIQESRPFSKTKKWRVIKKL